MSNAEEAKTIIKHIDDGIALTNQKNYEKAKQEFVLAAQKLSTFWVQLSKASDERYEIAHNLWSAVTNIQTLIGKSILQFSASTYKSYPLGAYFDNFKAAFKQ